MPPDETALQTGGEQMFPIQRILAPFGDMPQSLYQSGAAGQADTANTVLASGERVSFDSFFNSFYPDYWHHHTTVEKAALRLRLTGAVELKIFTDDGENGACVRESHEITAHYADETVVVWLPDFGQSSPHSERLFFSLTAREKTQVFALDYVTDLPPGRDIKLSLGLCTFNREEGLAATIRELKANRSSLPELIDIFMVNQGDRFSDPTLLADIADLGIVVIEQDNLGGCGGFNRTMSEATKSISTPSHHLLMDDDIVLDARVIRRALDFLSYTTKSMVLGGSMLEIQHPEKLWESGSRIGPYWTINSIGSGTDLSVPENLNTLNKAEIVDYNAWWFCLMPIGAIRQAGLSLPVFLHGDDIEYGCRLSRAGVETLVVPGVSVWHESFIYKPRDWIYYYDFRNTLINASLHPQISEQPDPVITFGAIFIELLCHRYGAAQAMILAVRDYLSGPDTTFAVSPAIRHGELTAELAQFKDAEHITIAPGTSVEYGPTTKPSADIWPMVKLFLQRFLQLSIPGLRRCRVLHFADLDLHPINTGAGPYALVRNSAHTEFALYRPNRLQFWWGTGKAVAVSAKYALRWRSAQRNWLEKAPELSSDAFWLRFFKPRDEPIGKD